jgi:hypothetical protein
MKYAIAMYRAGFMIDAEKCDHESARKFGLICPFCKEAVFLRSGTTFLRNEKEILIPKSFVHYADKGSSTDSEECELRSKRKDGIQYLEKLRIESKGQRLELYNKHLWAIIASDRNIPREDILRQRKWFGFREILIFTKKVSKLWAKSQALGINRKNFLLSVDAIANLDTTVLLKNFEVDTEMNIQSDWLKGTDQKLHIELCCEIGEFIGTKTGTYVLERIIAACFILMRYGEPDLKPEDVELSDRMLLIICGFIAGTHWSEQLEELAKAQKL